MSGRQSTARRCHRRCPWQRWPMPSRKVRWMQSPPTAWCTSHRECWYCGVSVTPRDPVTRRNADAPPMLNSTTLLRWLRMVSHDEDLVISTERLNDEATSNMWYFSPSDDVCHEMDAHQVESFVRQVIENRRSLLRKLSSPEMVFYCWHDAVARQLRFSMVSACHGRLPFSCDLHATADLHEVIHQVVNEDWLVPNGARDDAEDEPGQEAAPRLTVFVAHLPCARES